MSTGPSLPRERRKKYPMENLIGEMREQALRMDQKQRD